MKPSKSLIHHDPRQITKQLSGWYAHRVDDSLLKDIDNLMSKYLRNRPGYYAAEFGFLKHDSNWFIDSNIRSCFQMYAEDGDIIIDFERLPLAAESMDYIIASHVLEFVRDPHQILREIDRVLIPEGYLITLGFNPYSVQGMNKWFQYKRIAPWSGHYYSMWRLKDWFSVLGFEVQSVHHFMPPLFTCGRFRRLSQLFNQYMPWFGSLTVIMAKKLVSRVTPLHANKDIRSYIKGRIIQPTTFNSNHVTEHSEHIH